MLAQLYTDFWSGALVRKWGPPQLAGRYHGELADAPVTGLHYPFLRSALRNTLFKKTGSALYLEFARYGKAFSRGVARRIQREYSSLNDHLFFAYDTGFLEAGSMAKARGAFTALGQIDPGRVEFEIVREEEERFPGWALQPLEVPESYNLRREKEWEIADCIMVNSDWSAKALQQQGVPQDKITVVPLAYEIGENFRQSEKKPDKKFTVLFLGQVILRKGIQYLIQAAELLEREPVQFIVAGPLGINLKAIPRIPGNVSFRGPVPRSQIQQHYRNADVFLLPTLSDGFAITQLEAMAHSIPVIATPCCGDVVSHDQDGWIVPARNPQAIAETVRRAMEDPGKVALMGGAASRKARAFDIHNLTNNLKEIESHAQPPGGFKTPGRKDE